MHFNVPVDCTAQRSAEQELFAAGVFDLVVKFGGFSKSFFADSRMSDSKLAM